MRQVAHFSARLTAALLILTLVLIGSLTASLYSQSVHQWLLQTITAEVEDIQILNPNGSVAGGLQFDFVYDDGDTRVELQQAGLQINPRCLLQLELCVKYIKVDEVRVVVSESGDATPATTTTIALPEIVIPASVVADRISVAKLVIEQGSTTLYAAHDIELSASAIHHRVNATAVRANDEFCQWQGQGMIRLTRRYPMEVNITCNTEIYPLHQLTASAKGDLDNLDLSAHSQGDLNGTLDLNLQPLADDLPMNFHFTQQQPFIYAVATDAKENSTITAMNTTLAGTGNLDSLQLQLTAQLSSELFPSPVTVSSRGQLATDKLQLDALNINLPRGQILNQGELVFNPQLQWRFKSTLQQVNLQQFADDVAGEVSGSLEHSGSYADEHLLITAALNQIKGSLFDTPWSLQGNVVLADTQLKLDNVQLQQNNNRASANGQLDLNGDSDLQLALDINQFDLVLPQLQGSLQANLKLSGHVENPKVEGTLKAARLHYQEIMLAHARADINLQSQLDGQNRVQLRFDQLQIADQITLNGRATLEGNVKNHLAAIHLQETAGNDFDIQCRGQFPMNNTQVDFAQWQADCNRSNLHVAYLQPAQDWALQKAFSVALHNAEQLTVSPFCYANNGSTLCLQQAVTASAEDISPIRLRGKQLDLAWLQPWLPAGSTLQGSASITADIKPLPELIIDATASSQNARITLFDNTSHKVPLLIDHADFNAHMDAQNSRLQWSITSSNGNSEAKVSLQGEQLSGYLALADFDVNPFSYWLLAEEDDHIRGWVSGRFELDGTLPAPQLQGSANLRAGEIHTIMLPLPITDISLDLRAEDQVAILTGQFNVSKKPGQLQGTFNWQQEDWWSKISLQSDTIAYQPEEEIRIYLKPDISFDITPHSLALRGNVHIPKARIHLKTLPEQAVSASPDVEIIGNEQQQSSPLKISSNLNLSLGDDVRFKGYGLETDLTGQMSISQEQSSLLQGKGIIRLEHGSYQAYGQSLNITDGDLIFIDALENPQLRLSATRNNISDNVVVGIRVTGRARNPDITIFSIPEMPPQEKLHYLVTGRAPNTENTTDSSSVAAEAALAMALESKGGALTRKAGETFGIQDLSLSTGSTENRSEVGLSGYLTPDLMIRYGVGMFEAVNTLTLKYRIRKNLFAEIISGKSNAFDILWSFDRN